MSQVPLNTLFFMNKAPLYTAVQGNATDAILALLRLGADPNYKNGANPRSTTKGEGAWRERARARGRSHSGRLYVYLHGVHVFNQSMQ